MKKSSIWLAPLGRAQKSQGVFEPGEGSVHCGEETVVVVEFGVGLGVRVGAGDGRFSYPKYFGVGLYMWVEGLN